jgi:sigma-E factor negative regulatory protein RseB
MSSIVVSLQCNSFVPGLIRRRAVLWLTLICLCTLAPTTHSIEPSRWLNRMVEAARTLNYDGTFVFRSGNVTESMRIIHRYDDAGERERLVSLDGAAREVIRDNDYVTCILPDDATVLVGQRWLLRGFQSSPLFGASELPKTYTITFEARDRVAGRTASRVRIRPTDEHRYGYRLWLDEDTGLLLRSTLLGSGDRVLEEIVYTRLDVLASIPDALLAPSVTGAGFKRFERTHVDAPKGPVEKSHWESLWAPDGFVLVDKVVTRQGSGGSSVEHMVFSDGLASYSIFIERLAPGAESLQGVSHIGAVSAFGVMVDEHQVTVVGEVPTATVQRVGRSVSK